MKVVSTKYKVAISIITIFNARKCVHASNCFTTTIDTMLFSVSFTEILMSYGSSVRSWTLETRTQLTLLDLQSTGKITWMKFKPDLALQLIKKTYVLFECFCYTVLYGL